MGCGLDGLHEVFNLEIAHMSEKQLVKINNIQERHSCGVHIHRGDLANNDNPYYGKFSEDYLLKAMDYLKKKGEEVCFYAFSDDLDWVKTVFSKKCNYSITLMEGNTGGEDLILLSNCRYIIASQGLLAG